MEVRPQEDVDVDREGNVGMRCGRYVCMTMPHALACRWAPMSGGVC